MAESFLLLTSPHDLLNGHLDREGAGLGGPRVPPQQRELPALAKRLNPPPSLNGSLTPLPVAGEDGAGTMQFGLFSS